MSLRPPKAYSSKLPDNPIAAALDQEILAEKVSTHSRLMERLETALAALAAFDAQAQTSGRERQDGATGNQTRGEERRDGATGNQTRGEEGGTPDREANKRCAPPQDEAGADTDPRTNLLARAGEALWHVVVQRELMRLPGTERFLKEMKVPAELRLRMGVMRRR